MTFNELVAWIVAKPLGRIRIERDGANRKISFYLSCQSSRGAVVAMDEHVHLYELQFLGSKEAVEAELARRFDGLKEDLDRFAKEREPGHCKARCEKLMLGARCVLADGHAGSHEAYGLFFEEPDRCTAIVGNEYGERCGKDAGHEGKHVRDRGD